jgi:hypothetical protein
LPGSIFVKWVFVAYEDTKKNLPKTKGQPSAYEALAWALYPFVEYLDLTVSAETWAVVINDATRVDLAKRNMVAGDEIRHSFFIKKKRMV